MIDNCSNVSDIKIRLEEPYDLPSNVSNPFIEINISLFIRPPFMSSITLNTLLSFNIP